MSERESKYDWKVIDSSVSKAREISIQGEGQPNLELAVGALKFFLLLGNNQAHSWLTTAHV